MDPVTITITDLVKGPIAPRANETGPNTLHTRVADVVAKMGAAPWSRRIIADERNLVTLIATPPGGGNRPHWHKEFDEWWVVLGGKLQWELTGGVIVNAAKDDIGRFERRECIVDHGSAHLRRVGGGQDHLRISSIRSPTQQICLPFRPRLPLLANVDVTRYDVFERSGFRCVSPGERVVSTTSR